MPTKPHIVFITLFYNSEKYLRYFDAMIGRLLRTVDAEVKLVWFENNSSDGTRGLLEELSKKYQAQLLGDDDFDRQHGIVGAAREIRIAAYRNHAKDWALSQYSADYVAMSDADVFFDASILDRLIDGFSFAENVSMVCPWGEDLRHPGHYYDTYTYFDIEGNNFGFKCPFTSCSVCELNLRELGDTPFNVQAAFGGIALIRTDKLQMLGWGSDGSESDHVALCRGLRAEGGGILVTPRAKVWWTKSFNLKRRLAWRKRLAKFLLTDMDKHIENA